jgi:hypothetical protein
MNLHHRGSPIQNLLECVEFHMNFQVPLMIIDQEVSRSNQHIKLSHLIMVVIVENN